MSSPVIRDYRRGDEAALLPIHNYYARETAVNFDWEEMGERAFAKRIEQTISFYPFLVAERDDAVVGYAYAGPFVGRAAYGWASELTIYLAPDERGRGTGRALYQALEVILAAMGIQNLYACIGYPETEDERLTFASAAFHEHMGFSLVGHHHRCGYKFGRWYDMVWMEKIIGDHENVAPVISYPELSNQQ